MDLSFDIEWSDKTGLLGFSTCKDEALGGSFVPYFGDLDALRLELMQFCDPSISLIMHNAEYELTKMFEMTGIMLPVGFDTMIAAKMVWPFEKSYSLKALAVEKLGMQPWGSAKEMIAQYGDMGSVPKPLLYEYGRIDAVATLALKKKLVADPMFDLAKVAFQIECAVISLVVKLNHTEVVIDQEILASVQAEIETILNSIHVEITRMNDGVPLNLNVYQSVSHFLYGKCGIDPEKHSVPKGKTGYYSTNADFVSKIEHPGAQAVTRARQMSSLLSTFIPAVRRPSLQASWSQNGSITGRMSCSGPNLQNVPIKTKEGRQIRKAFVAPDGYVVVVVDFSQQELIIVAGMSHCKNMITYLANKQDIHVITASAIFKVPPFQVTKAQRNIGKGGNYAQIYGGLAPGFDWGMYREWFKMFPEIKQYQEDAVKEAQQYGYVRTYWGKPLRSGVAKTIATNYKVQGTGALVIKVAMIRADRMIADKQFDAHLVMQVHDELVFYVRAEQAKPFMGFLKDELETIPFPVPFKVDVGMGSNWLEAK